MANQYTSKVVLGSEVLIDLTADTAVADKVLAGYTFHDKSGAPVTGTSTFDVDSSNATAAASEILSGKTAAVNGSIITGTMANNGGVTGSISTVAGEYSIPVGYHDGSGKVSIDSVEQAKIVATNIREGVTLLGVTGTMSGEEDVHAQSKSVTPSLSQQVVTPDTEDNYNYLSQVTVEAIPVTRTDNVAGGVTVTIAA